MAKDYDDYGYEKNEQKDNTSLVRRILIVVMILIAIVLLIFLIKGCSSSTSNNNNSKIKPQDNTVVTYDYESNLLIAGRKYFERNIDENPMSPGECSVVSLEQLIHDGLIDQEKFANCNVSTTYVKLCILENKTRHYTPWLTCANKMSEDEYNSLEEGRPSDIIADKTYVEFKFLGQKLKNGEEILGDAEEVWADEVKYDQYKTIAKTKYYRYRDKLYTWELTKKFYYTKSGEKTSASQVNEYYVSSPATGYNKSSDKTTEAYKWYKSDATKEYYMKNGAKQVSATAPDGYPNRDPNGIDVTRYRTRTITGVYRPTKYYVCSTSASSQNWIYQINKCGEGTNKEFKYQQKTIYSCAKEGELIAANEVPDSSLSCYNYSDWSSVTSTPCNTSKPNVCQSVTVTFYYWYKIKNDVRSYYPSGYSKAANEKVYYTEAPIKDAIKDTSTKTTAYKWYKEVKTKTSTYTAVAPSGFSTATKSKDYQWTDWSGWSTTDPKAKDSRDRSVEIRNKLKIREIKGTTTAGWNDINDGYVSEEELIRAFQNKGYDVKTLEDIVNNGEIRYQLQLFIKNKKESK